MNIKQIKQKIKQFRTADVSAISDEKLRSKAKTLQAKQGGFTLLELLVVITILATLSTAALVAYEGIGENATDTASANNLLSAENSIRNYRAIEGKYPEQWDNLANVDGTVAQTNGMLQLLAPETEAFFGQWVIPLATHTTTPAGTVYEAVANAMNAVGIKELQSIDSNAAFGAGFVPNLALNESYPLTTNPGAEIALDPTGAQFNGASPAAALALSIVPSITSSIGTPACTADAVSITTALDTTAVATNARLNLVNDVMESDACSLVLALGFGKDMPGSTFGSRVAIAQAPTAATKNINPANNYARYVALFQVAEDGSDGSAVDGIIQVGEVFPKARLVGLVDPEGNIIDNAIAGANADG